MNAFVIGMEDIGAAPKIEYPGRDGDQLCDQTPHLKRKTLELLLRGNFRLNAAAWAKPKMIVDD